MKAREFDKVVNKLGMVIRDSSHHHAWLVHEGVTIVRTKRSHGDNKFVPEHLIRKQLHVSQDQFAGLHSCSITKEEYIQILIDKRVITPKQESPSEEQTPEN
jgi:hypothetical protein